MKQKAPTISPLLAQAQSMIAELRAVPLAWHQIASASSLSIAGLRNIESGKNKDVTHSTLDGLRAAVGMLHAGLIGPQRTHNDTETAMVEKFNRDAKEAGLPLWEELRERDRDEIRARWQRVAAELREHAVAVESEFLRWAESLVRERTPTR